jgi:hypothetical protein
MENMSRELHADDSRRLNREMARQTRQSLEHQPADLREYNLIGKIMEYAYVTHGPLLIDNQDTRDSILRRIGSVYRFIDKISLFQQAVLAIKGQTIHWPEAHYLDALVHHSLTEVDEANIDAFFRRINRSIVYLFPIQSYFDYRQKSPEEKVILVSLIADTFSRIETDDIEMNIELFIDCLSELGQLVPTFHLSMAQIILNELRTFEERYMNMLRNITNYVANEFRTYDTLIQQKLNSM